MASINNHFGHHHHGHHSVLQQGHHHTSFPQVLGRGGFQSNMNQYNSNILRSPVRAQSPITNLYGSAVLNGNFNGARSQVFGAQSQVFGQNQLNLQRSAVLSGLSTNQFLTRPAAPAVYGRCAAPIVQTGRVLGNYNNFAVPEQQVQTSVSYEEVPIEQQVVQYVPVTQTIKDSYTVETRDYQIPRTVLQPQYQAVPVQTGWVPNVYYTHSQAKVVHGPGSQLAQLKKSGQLQNQTVQNVPNTQNLGGNKNLGYHSLSNAGQNNTQPQNNAQNQQAAQPLAHSQVPGQHFGQNPANQLSRGPQAPQNLGPAQNLTSTQNLNPNSQNNNNNGAQKVTRTSRK